MLNNIILLIVEAPDDTDTTLERALLSIVNLLKKQHEQSKSINERLEMLFDSDSARQQVNDSMRTVLELSMEYFSNMQQIYESVPNLLDNISMMYIENNGVLNSIYELLNDMKNRQNYIKDNIGPIHSAAPYLTLSQEEFLEAIAIPIAISTNRNSEEVFKRLVWWGAHIQEKESINLKNELRDDTKRHKYWIKFLMWLRKEFNNLDTVTVVVIHSMYTVFVSRITVTRIVDHESMQTLIKLFKQALQKGDNN